jgi:hypothetical protein
MRDSEKPVDRDKMGQCNISGKLEHFDTQKIMALFTQSADWPATNEQTDRQTSRVGANPCVAPTSA